MTDHVLCRALRFPLPGPWLSSPDASRTDVADVWAPPVLRIYQLAHFCGCRTMTDLPFIVERDSQPGFARSLSAYAQGLQTRTGLT